MDCIVHGVKKSQTRLSNFHFSFTFQELRFKERDVKGMAAASLGLASVCGPQTLMLGGIIFPLAVSNLLICVLIVYFQFFLHLDLRFSTCYEVLTDDVVLLLFF